MAEFIQITVTAPDQNEAEQLAKELIERRLAACVQVLGPVVSTYRWKNKIERSQEYFCIAKTRLEKYAALEQAVSDLHSYDVPEIIATPIIEGSHAYLDWLRHELAEPESVRPAAAK